MSTSSLPMSKHNSLVERLEEFSSGFTALHCTLASDISQIERPARSQSSVQTRSQSKTPSQASKPTETQSTEQIAKQHDKSAYDILVAVLRDLDSLKVQLEAITNDAEAQDSVNEQVMKEATSGLQMDTRSGEVATTTPIGIPEQERPSQSQASRDSSPTSDDQRTVGSEDVAVQSEGVSEAVDTQAQPEAFPDMPEGQQPVESEYVIMGESESADGLAPSHSLEGNDDDTAHHTTPEPTTPRPSQWVSLNIRAESSSTGSYTAASESRASTVDRSPAGSVSTRITWPDSSTGACEQDTTMSGVESTDDDQSRYCPAGGLNATPAETNIIQPPQGSAANETTSMADSVVDIEANSAPQTPQGHITNDEANSPGSRQSPAADDTDVQGDTDQQDTGPQSRLPTLSLADKARLISKIQELEAQGRGQHISIPPVGVDMEDIKRSIGTGKWRCKTCEYVGQKGGGYASIYAGKPKNQPFIDWSAFTAEFKRPTTEEAKAVFESTARNPPKGKIPYYIGHADILSGQALDPGPLITGNSDLKDIHTNYHHIGGHLSGNRIHCEDFTYLDETDEGPVWRGLRSFNEVYIGTGYKLWLLVAKRHIAKFDAFVRKTWQCRECIGGVAHRCLFLAPSSLEKAGIDFHIYVVGRGEAVWTLPGQQHSIINVGHCAARSMNFLYPGESIDFKKLAHCLDCDQHPLSIQYGTPLVSTEPDRKRKQHQAQSHLPLKKTRNETAPQRELVKIKEALQAANLTYRPIAIDDENPSVAEVNVYKPVAAVRSTLAIEQFVEVVRQCRDPEIKTQLIQARSSLDGAVELIKAADDHTKAPKLRVRLGQLNLSQQAEKGKTGSQTNHKAGFLDEFAAKHGLTRPRLKHHLQEGRKWTSLCTSHDGLLPFIFLKSETALGITKEDWMTATRDENNKAFHKLLDDNYTKNLCIAGKALERLLFGELVKFLWEKNGLDLDAHNIDELLKEYEIEEASAAPTEHSARGAMA
ncbi:hypothetical protein FDENT_9665 [Fusarium denticulatum]|uniref:JmjC domain-containing protein n=1 Tax=Fusarium denticulatum TaxID=48507 RepID=A0A8H5TP05_9HYPO|nr:hypothetical protein FDENT_9665 [Fusarium denticulatum]